MEAPAWWDRGNRVDAPGWPLGCMCTLSPWDPSEEGLWIECWAKPHPHTLLSSPGLCPPNGLCPP